MEKPFKVIEVSLENEPDMANIIGNMQNKVTRDKNT
jgi:hypothetical protein